MLTTSGTLSTISPRVIMSSQQSSAYSRSSPKSQPAPPTTMPRGTSWAISRPVLRAATASANRGLRCNLSTRSGTQATAAAAGAVQGAEPKMPRLTNRLRRLAKAHPEAVATISPSAVEASRAKYSAGAPHSEVSDISRQLSCDEI